MWKWSYCYMWWRGALLLVLLVDLFFSSCFSDEYSYNMLFNRLHYSYACMLMLGRIIIYLTYIYLYSYFLLMMKINNIGIYNLVIENVSKIQKNNELYY